MEASQIDNILILVLIIWNLVIKKNVLQFKLSLLKAEATN